MARVVLRLLGSKYGYSGFRSGGAQFILQQLDVPPFAENLMIRIDVPDLDAWWAEVSALDLPSR